MHQKNTWKKKTGLGVWVSQCWGWGSGLLPGKGCYLFSRFFSEMRKQAPKKTTCCIVVLLLFPFAVCFSTLLKSDFLACFFLFSFSKGWYIESNLDPVSTRITYCRVESVFRSEKEEQRSDCCQWPAMPLLPGFVDFRGDGRWTYPSPHDANEIVIPLFWARGS